MASPQSPTRHVIIIDGTQSRLEPGYETNAGLLLKLLREANSAVNTKIWYDRGIQGHGFWNWVTLASGWGINALIRDAYGILSAKYKPGDQIYLFGFSRGAFAVRSVAGMITQMGLIRQDAATERNIRTAFRHYEQNASPDLVAKFSAANCHAHVPIEMIGVWDTVKALGLPYPVLTHLAPMATEFHNHVVGPNVKAAYQALALDERRLAYRPVMWETHRDWLGRIEQVWFAGAHPDVGGQVWQTPQARPLANIPLVWMLNRVARHGLSLPQGWQDRFERDVTAEPVGDKRGIGKFFLLRQTRIKGAQSGEFLHASVADRQDPQKLPLPVQQSG